MHTFIRLARHQTSISFHGAVTRVCVSRCSRRRAVKVSRFAQRQDSYTCAQTFKTCGCSDPRGVLTAAGRTSMCVLWGKTTNVKELIKDYHFQIQYYSQLLEVNNSGAVKGSREEWMPRGFPQFNFSYITAIIRKPFCVILHRQILVGIWTTERGGGKKYEKMQSDCLYCLC